MALETFVNGNPSTPTPTPGTPLLAPFINKLADLVSFFRDNSENALRYNNGAFTAATLNAAITDIGSARRSLLIPAGNWTIDANVNFGATNIKLVFDYGAVLVRSGSSVFTLPARYSLTESQHFNGTAGFIVFSKCNFVDPVWWGAESDGTEDDYPAFHAATTACPKRAEFRVPYGLSRLNSQWRIPKGVNLRGRGTQCAILSNPGAGVDGIVVSNLDGAGEGDVTETQGLVWRNFAILANAQVRDALVMEVVQRSTFRGLHIRGAVRNYLYLRGCLNNRFVECCFNNKNMVYEHAASDVNPGIAGGSFVHIGPRINSVQQGGFIGTNNNSFEDCRLEGGSFTPGASAAFFQEDQGSSDEGNNYLIGGVIQGIDGGRAVEIYQSGNGMISAVHMEKGANILLNNCRNWQIGAGLIMASQGGGAELKLESSHACKVDGAYFQGLHIDAACLKNVVSNFILGNSSYLVNLSTSTIFTGGGMDTDNFGTAGYAGPAIADFENLCWNYDFSRWRTSPAGPDGFTLAGTPPVATRIGEGQGDTDTHISPWAAQIVTTVATDAFRWTIPVSGGDGEMPRIGTFWVSASIWVKRVTNGTALIFRCTRNGGAATLKQEETSISGTWVRLSLNVLVDAAWTSLEFDVFPNADNVTFKVSTPWTGVGNATPHQSGPSSKNLRQAFYSAGRKISIGSPHNSRAEIGDLALTDVAGGVSIRHCTSAGTPGTYKSLLAQDAYLIGYQTDDIATPSIGNEDGLRVARVVAGGATFPEANGNLLYFTHQTDSYRASFWLFKGQASGKLWFRSADPAGANAWLPWRAVGLYLEASATWDPGNMSVDGDVVSTTIAVSGAAVGDQVSATHDQIGANSVFISAHVQAADTVRVTLMNKTGGGLNIASGALAVKVWK